MADIYKEFDLGEYDEELRGQTVAILRNPTRAFRQSFVTASGSDFLEHVARILATDVPGVEVAMGCYDAALFVWLFIPTFDDGKLQLPRVYALWDEYTAERVKALRAPLASSSAGATNAQS